MGGGGGGGALEPCLESGADWGLKVRYCLGQLEISMGHVRYINILTWLRGFRVKIANLSSFFCLSIPKRDLDTKNTTPNIEV